MRLFHLQRGFDGIRAADGCVFEDGQVVLQWLTPYRVMSWYPDLAILEAWCVTTEPHEVVWDDLPTIQVKLEDLGANQELLVEALCGKLGVPYEPQRPPNAPLPFLGMPGPSHAGG